MNQRAEGRGQRAGFQVWHSCRGLEALLRFAPDFWRRLYLNEEFPNAVMVSGDLRFPEGDVLDWCERHRMRAGPAFFVLERHARVSELALLCGWSDDWWRERIVAGDLGDGVLCIGGEYRVPASAVARFFSIHEDNGGIVARSVGELRRKLEVAA